MCMELQRGLWQVVANSPGVHWRKAKKNTRKGNRFTPLRKGGGLMRLIVWNEHQKIPAARYGECHFGINFKVIISSNPFATKERMGGIIYHFT